MPVCAIISFRLGQHDGVSVVAQHWQQILTDLGFETYTIAGEGRADILLPGLARYATEPPTATELEQALAPSDFALVENIGTIPMNLPASLEMLKTLKGHSAIMHHHDPSWQREHWMHITDLPGDDQAWQHVVINDITQVQMAARSFDATRIYNPFETNPEPGDRAACRSRLGVSDEELLVFHPVRAIRRKNVPAAVRLAEKLGGVYWLAGPPEDGYGPTLDSILREAECRVVAPVGGGGARGAEVGSGIAGDSGGAGDGSRDNSDLTNHHAISANDMYAAADLVVYPSWWEGFGNPPVEAAIHHLPAVVGDYPVAQELRQLGFKWFYPWEISDVANFLASPDRELLDHNFALAEQHFSFPVIQAQVKNLLEKSGWL